PPPTPRAPSPVQTTGAQRAPGPVSFADAAKPANPQNWTVIQPQTKKATNKAVTKGPEPPTKQWADKPSKRVFLRLAREHKLRSVQAETLMALMEGAAWGVPRGLITQAHKVGSGWAITMKTAAVRATLVAAAKKQGHPAEPEEKTVAYSVRGVPENYMDGTGAQAPVTPEVVAREASRHTGQETKAVTGRRPGPSVYSGPTRPD
ncbi:hypothetical protein GGTG_13755, partial [Gaeumannomyces tritici R3-111a-1]